MGEPGLDGCKAYISCQGIFARLSSTFDCPGSKRAVLLPAFEGLGLEDAADVSGKRFNGAWQKERKP